MNKKPLVAVVGSPNVGKSTLFNKLSGKKISIIKDEPGVTRDRIYCDCEWLDKSFTLVDTGGIDLKNKENTQKNIMNQVEIAIQMAEVILFVVDGKAGLTSLDKEVASFLRKANNKKIILVVNKLDNFQLDNTYEFYQLGIGEPYPISAEQGKGLGELLDKIVDSFDNKLVSTVEDKSLKIAIVGKPNSGKSSIVNKILGENRVVVSDEAGTTRDSIDTPFRYHGKDYIIIDTAGIRRKSKIEFESVEKYSVIRSFESIRRSDIVLYVIDSAQGISEQDMRILGYIHEEGKPSLLAMNKWDLINKSNDTMNEFTNLLKNELAFMNYLQIIYISAKTGQRFSNIMPEINRIYSNSSTRIKTSILNEVIGDAVSSNPPPSKKGKSLKILYATQASVNPPTFIIFCNDPKLAHYSYERYINNYLRRSFNFEGTPIKIIFKSRNSDAIGK